MAGLNFKFDKLENSLTRVEDLLRQLIRMRFGKEWEEVKDTPIEELDAEWKSKSDSDLDSQSKCITKSDVSSIASVSVNIADSASMPMAEEKNHHLCSSILLTTASVSMAAGDDEQEVLSEAASQESFLDMVQANEVIKDHNHIETDSDSKLFDSDVMLSDSEIIIEENEHCQMQALSKQNCWSTKLARAQGISADRGKQEKPLLVFDNEVSKLANSYSGHDFVFSSIYEACYEDKIEVEENFDKNGSFHTECKFDSEIVRLHWFGVKFKIWKSDRKNSVYDPGGMGFTVPPTCLWKYHIKYARKVFEERPRRHLATSRMQYILYLVFNFMQSIMARIISRPEERLSEPHDKCYTYQLLLGLQHCHDKAILHQDIKGSNLLIVKNGMLKLVVFGLAKFYSPDHNQPLTSRVVTLWYKAIEMLLGATDYGIGIDLRSIGCLLTEMFIEVPIMQLVRNILTLWFYYDTGNGAKEQKETLSEELQMGSFYWYLVNSTSGFLENHEQHLNNSTVVKYENGIQIQFGQLNHVTSCLILTASKDMKGKLYDIFSIPFGVQLFYLMEALECQNHFWHYCEEKEFLSDGTIKYYEEWPFKSYVHDEKLIHTSVGFSFLIFATHDHDGLHLWATSILPNKVFLSLIHVTGRIKKVKVLTWIGGVEIITAATILIIVNASCSLVMLYKLMSIWFVGVLVVLCCIGGRKKLMSWVVIGGFLLDTRFEVYYGELNHVDWFQKPMDIKNWEEKLQVSMVLIQQCPLDNIVIFLRTRDKSRAIVISSGMKLELLTDANYEKLDSLTKGKYDSVFNPCTSILSTVGEIKQDACDAFKSVQEVNFLLIKLCSFPFDPGGLICGYKMIVGLVLESLSSQP